jgi:hypothetical protein
MLMRVHSGDDKSYKISFSSRASKPGAGYRKTESESAHGELGTEKANPKPRVRSHPPVPYTLQAGEEQRQAAENHQCDRGG